MGASWLCDLGQGDLHHFISPSLMSGPLQTVLVELERFLSCYVLPREIVAVFILKLFI